MNQTHIPGAGAALPPVPSLPPLPAHDAVVCTSSGLRFDLVSPRAEQVRLADIARHLSRINRFNGGTGPLPWSVAAHSLLVADVVERTIGGRCDPQLKLAALLHDAHEAYIGDLITPVKAMMRALLPHFAAKWRFLVDAIQHPIHVAFGLPAFLPASWVDVITAADEIALHAELRDLVVPAKQVDLPNIETLRPFDDPNEDEERFVSAVLTCIEQHHGLLP